MSSYKILKEDGDDLLLETGDFLLQDPPILVDISDSVLILESIFLNNAYEIDDIFITESISITMDAGDISISDSISIVDNVNILHDVWYASVSESVSISESLSFDWPFIIRANETISMSEDVGNQSIRYSSDNRRPRYPGGGISGSLSLIE